MRSKDANRNNVATSQSVKKQQQCCSDAIDVGLRHFIVGIYGVDIRRNKSKTGKDKAMM